MVAPSCVCGTPMSSFVEGISGKRCRRRRLPYFTNRERREQLLMGPRMRGVHENPLQLIALRHSLGQPPLQVGQPQTLE
jgi:hypothetical protein